MPCRRVVELLAGWGVPELSDAQVACAAELSMHARASRGSCGMVFGNGPLENPSSPLTKWHQKSCSVMHGAWAPTFGGDVHERPRPQVVQLHRMQDSARGESTWGSVVPAASITTPRACLSQ